MSFTKARDNYYWKPLLKSFMRNNDSTTEIAQKLGKSRNSTGSLIRRLFGTESLKKLKDRKDFI